jgi:hypothetical protein
MMQGLPSGADRYSDCEKIRQLYVIRRFNTVFTKLYCIPKAMVGWERRMWNALGEREALSALEHLRIEIQVHSNSR